MREKLLETALELFRKHGYKNVSVQSICEACSVTKGCFYHNFTSKEDLLLRYYQMIPSEMLMERLALMMTEKSPIRQLWMYLEFYVECTTRLGQDLLRELMKINMDRGGLLFTPYYESQQPPVPDFLKMVQTLTEEGQRQGEITKTAAWDKLLWLYTTSFIGALMHWSCAGAQYDVKEELHFSFLYIYQKSVEE